MKSELVNELTAALSKAQGAIKNATMNKVNPHFKSKYADLASVRDAIQKPLAENGLAVSQTMEIREGGLILVTTLWHSSGQWISSEYPLPATARPHELGSALTYARRYSLSALVCNSSDEDDDANAAEEQKQKIETKVKPSSMKKEEIAPVVYKIPQRIDVPASEDGFDWLKWGGLFVAALNASTTDSDVAKWSAFNAESLVRCAEEAPKVFERIEVNIKTRSSALSKTKGV